MKTKFDLRILSGIVLICMFLFALPIHADTFIRSEKHTDAYTVMGQTITPAKDEVTSAWITRDKFRNDMEEQSSIVRFDKKKMYLLDHAEKTYSAVDLPIDWSKMLPPEAQQMTQQWLQMFKMTVTVRDTGETKNIRGWNCRKYIVDMQGMMSMKNEIWATKDIKIDYDAYRKFAESMMSIAPMFKDMATEARKIEGYPILTKTTMNMMGASINSIEEVIEVSEKRAPEGTYQVPSGYKETHFNPMGSGR